MPSPDVTVCEDARSIIEYPMGYNKIQWDQILPLLGKEPDTSLAKRLHVSQSSLYDKRTALGIPPYRSIDSINWDEITPLLGKMPDSHIAKKFKISCQLIGEKRKGLEIPVFSKKKAT